MIRICPKHRLILIAARPKINKKYAGTLIFECRNCQHRFVFKRNRIHRILLSGRPYHRSYLATRIPPRIAS